MKLKITNVRMITAYGRTVAVASVRNEADQVVMPEKPLSALLVELKDHDIVNAREVLECVVLQLGFSA